MPRLKLGRREARRLTTRGENEKQRRVCGHFRSQTSPYTFRLDRLQFVQALLIFGSFPTCLRRFERPHDRANASHHLHASANTGNFLFEKQPASQFVYVLCITGLRVSILRDCLPKKVSITLKYPRKPSVTQLNLEHRTKTNE